jgi:hypothetical protein
MYSTVAKGWNDQKQVLAKQDRVWKDEQPDFDLEKLSKLRRRQAFRNPQTYGSFLF